MSWVPKPCGCPGQGAGRGGCAWPRAEPSALGPPLVGKNLLLATTKEREKWGECPDGLHPRGFPEGLTQTGFQASPFPPNLVETFIPVPWTHPPKVHTISEYTPIYSLLLQLHLTARGSFPLTPAKCGTEVWGWGDGSLPERLGRQPNGRPVCLTLPCHHDAHSEASGKHCGSAGFSVCHDDSAFGATVGMLWVSPGGAVHAGSHRRRVSLCPTGHLLPAPQLGMCSCARDPGVLLLFHAHNHLGFLICSCKGTGPLFRSSRRMSQCPSAFP